MYIAGPKKKKSQSEKATHYDFTYILEKVKIDRKKCQRLLGVSGKRERD